jgi:hypothetical protein
MKGSLLDAVEKALAAGTEKNSIAARLGVSRSTIDRVLRTSHAVADARQRELLRREQAKRRSAWLSALKLASGSTAGARALEPACYAWLMRNDRPWLTSQRDVRQPPMRPSRRRLNWVARDQALQQRVKETAAGLAEKGKKVTLAALSRADPNLAKKVHQLALLPLTRSATVRCD